jgi:hypothetical protein
MRYELDQRNKRLAGLIALYAAKTTGVCLLIMGTVVSTILIFGESAPLVLILLVVVGGIGSVAYVMAKDRLEKLEYDEKRIMDRMKRDI